MEENAPLQKSVNTSQEAMKSDVSFQAISPAEPKSDLSQEKAEYSEGKEFDGIFSMLIKKYNGNLHSKGIVYVTASSTQANHPWKVIEKGWTSHWVSADMPDQFIRFDFNHMRLYITHYTLKTYNYIAGGNHLRSWVLEGSSNDNDWIELDRHQNCSDLNGRYNFMTYKCKTPASFRYFRIRQTGYSYCNSEMLALTNVEFFGSIRNE